MAIKGKIGVTTENIFPVIKQFLYSDHEIFLRELVANAVDATLKLKALASSGDFKEELGDLSVRIELDEKKKTLKVIDRGIGMTEDEVDRFINQIAFSSAGEFLEKYKDQATGIIGHFGLGFYSAFMVSDKVTIDTLSWKEGAEAVRWSCDGSPEYKMEPSDKKDRGTVITLDISEDDKEFTQKSRIESLLSKYCKFMPVPIVFGKETEWKEGKSVETDKDHVINNVEPLWTRQPSELKDEDYLSFYRALYPMDDEPLFWIHLNVDYPFTLTGILYFPKLRNRLAVDKNKIQLYCNQMFVTDHVDNIVPDFLTLLHGVIDSPDIPLNVSRSYLQADSNVKKISTYITKKVADRLEVIFKDQRSAYEQKWDDLKLFIQYGMLTNEKFCESALGFALLKNTDGKYFSLDEYRTAVQSEQTDKDKKVVYLYSNDPVQQFSYIEAAKNKGYDVLLMDGELDTHFVGLLEQKVKDTTLVRVDADVLENLIRKEDRVAPELSEDDDRDLGDLFQALLPKENNYYVKADNLGEDGEPIVISMDEFSRRYKDMAKYSGNQGMYGFYGQMPDSYTITVNVENPLVKEVFEQMKADIPPMEALPEEPASDAPQEEKDSVREQRQSILESHKQDIGIFAEDSDLLHQMTDLALLANGMLKGKALSDFIARSQKVVADAFLKKED